MGRLYAKKIYIKFNNSIQSLIVLSHFTYSKTKLTKKNTFELKAIKQTHYKRSLHELSSQVMLGNHSNIQGPFDKCITIKCFHKVLFKL